MDTQNLELENDLELIMKNMLNLFQVQIHIIHLLLIFSNNQRNLDLDQKHKDQILLNIQFLYQVLVNIKLKH
jgi:hypothetical protein